MEKITLLAGETMLLSMRNVANNKVQINFQEGIENLDGTINVLAILNEGDKRFKPSISQRQSWLTIEKSKLSLLNITKEQIIALEKGEVELNIKNPKLAGYRLVIQLTDKVDNGNNLTDYQKEVPEKAAKRRVNKNDETEYFVTQDGKLIFTDHKIVAEKDRKHHVISSNKRISWNEYQNSQVIDVAVGEALNAE